MEKVKIVLLSLCISIIVVSCSSENDEIQRVDSIKSIKVLDLAKSTTLNDWTEFPAQIHPFRNSELAFELSGKVVKFNYKVGDRLKKGDIVAQLDNTIYRSNLKASNANYKKALIDYKRYKKLYQSKSISLSKLEELRQNLDVSKSHYEIARKNLQNTKLIAEFNGVLAQKYIDDFARIVAKQKIAVLQDDSKFKVKFYVPENDIINEKEKMSLEKTNKIYDIFVLLGENKELKYKTRLIDISRKAEDITRTYEATALFENPKDTNILPGMTANLKVIEKNKNNSKLFIPVKALFSNHTKNSFVWIIDEDEKVHKREVKTGRLENGSIEIVNGLRNSDKIAISGINLLEENQQIKTYEKLGN